MATVVFTVVWLKVTEHDLAALQGVGRSHGARFVQADRKSLESKIIEARTKGVVVAIVSSDDEAGRAFRAGADAVLRAGDATSERLQSALEHAAEAASARARRMGGERPLDLEPKAFSLLMRALCHQIGHTLTTAWNQYESIAQRIEDVRQLNLKLTEWAALAAPLQEFRQLNSRAKVLFLQDVQGMLENVSGSLHRAEVALENAQLLSTVERREPVDVTVVLEELVELLRDEVKAWADLRVRASEKCEARIPIPFLVCLVTAIIGAIVDTFRELSQWDGRIEIRASVADGILVIEIQDNGPHLIEDLDSASHGAGTREGQLSRLRERIRAQGGEMLVESSEIGTAVRVYLSADEAALCDAKDELSTMESLVRTEAPMRPKS